MQQIISCLSLACNVPRLFLDIYLTLSLHFFLWTNDLQSIRLDFHLASSLSSSAAIVFDTASGRSVPVPVNS